MFQEAENQRRKAKGTAKKNDSCLGTGRELRARQTRNMPLKHALLATVWDTVSTPLTCEKRRRLAFSQGLECKWIV